MTNSLKLKVLAGMASVGSLVGGLAFATTDWDTGVSGALATTTADIIDLIGTTVLPVVLAITAGFFAINWAIRKIFGRRK